MFRGHGGSRKGGLRCWHWVKCVLRAWGQSKRGFEVLALGEKCSDGMGAVGKLKEGLEVLTRYEMLFEEIWVVEKGV